MNNLLWDDSLINPIVLAALINRDSPHLWHVLGGFGVSFQYSATEGDRHSNSASELLHFWLNTVLRTQAVDEPNLGSMTPFVYQSSETTPFALSLVSRT